jgi:hypothetical protein
MATLGLAPITLFSTRRLSSTVEHGLEGASQSWKKGAVLIYSSGLLVIGADAAVNIAGIALADATGVTNADVPFLRPTEDDEFEITLTVDALTYALLGTEMGNRYAIDLDATSGYFFADQSNTTDDGIVVTGFVSKVGDINPRVRCRILPAIVNAA